MIRRLLRLVVVVSALAALGATPHLPQPQTRTLANGLRVVLLERPGAGIVQVQLQVPAGLSAEPGARSGIASLTAQLLRQGTTSRTAAEMAAELDTLGASFVVNVTRDAAQVVAGARTAELE
ncbi:MAG: insulinase family protein, partial [bacterium]